MAGPFLVLLSDHHVRESIVQALRSVGWNVLRAVDVFGERNVDEELLAWTAADGRALATCDDLIHKAAWASLPRATGYATPTRRPSGPRR